MAITSQLGYVTGITFQGADENTSAVAYLQDENFSGGPYTLYAKIRVPYTSPTAASIVAISDASGTPGPGVVALMLIGDSLTAIMGGVSMSATGLTEGNNVHIALVRNGNTGTLYVDGIQAASSSNFGGSLSGDSLVVGNYDGKNWTDRIYRVSLFNRALSIEDIVKLAKHGVSETDRWGTTTGDGVDGCVVDLDLSIGVGRHFPDRSPNTLGADATPGIEHVLRTSYGLRTVVKRIAGEDISSTPGNTHLLDLPPNCGITNVEFDVTSGLGGDTLSVGTAGAPGKFVEDEAVPTGITWADSVVKVSQSNTDFTPVYLTRSSAGSGALRVRTIYEVRGLPSNPPGEPEPPGPTIIGVTLTATPLVVGPGDTSSLVAAVTGTGAFNPFVVFSVISGDGTLSDETGTTATLTVHTTDPVTVRATSSQDPTKWDEETITVEVANVLGDVPTSFTSDPWYWRGHFGFTDTPSYTVDRYKTLTEVQTTGNPGEIFRHEETQDLSVLSPFLKGSAGVGHTSNVVGVYTGYEVTLHNDPFAVGPGTPSFTGGHWTDNTNIQAEANKSSGSLVWYVLQDLSGATPIADDQAAATYSTPATPDLLLQDIVDSSSTHKVIQLFNDEALTDPTLVVTNNTTYYTSVLDRAVSFNVSITGTGPKTFRWRFQISNSMFHTPVAAGPWNNDEIVSGTTSPDITFICSEELAFWEGTAFPSSSSVYSCYIRVELI